MLTRIHKFVTVQINGPENVWIKFLEVVIQIIVQLDRKCFSNIVSQQFFVNMLVDAWEGDLC